MAQNNFKTCLPIILKHEGGYVDHPRDPGGATNLGVTIGTLKAWRGRPVTKAEVRALTVADVAPIYERNYWDATHCDSRAAGEDLCVFDAAVNSGPGRAMTWARQTGPLGPSAFVNKYCDLRMGFLRRLRHWDAFGKGWSRRVADIRARGLRMALGAEGASKSVVSTKLETQAVKAKAGAQQRQGAGAVLALPAGGTAASTTEVTTWTQVGALAVVTVLIALAIGYLFLRAREKMDEADALLKEASDV